MNAHLKKHNYEIDLVDLIVFLWRKKYVLVIGTFLITGAVLGSSYFFDPLYRSRITIYPKTYVGSDSSSLQSQLASRFFNTGGDQNLNTLLVFLRSDEILKKVAEKNRYLLYQEFYPDQYDVSKQSWPEDFHPDALSLAGKLRNIIEIEPPIPGGLILIRCGMKNPESPKTILESLIAEVKNILIENKKNLSQEKSQIIQKQLLDSKKQYLMEATALYNYFERNFSDSDSKAAGVNFKNHFFEDMDDILPKVTDKVLLEYLTTRKNVLNTINSSLEQAYHISKIRIENNYADFQIIDSPYVPKSFYFPDKKLFIIFGFIIGLFVMISTFAFYYIIQIYKKEYLKLRSAQEN